MGKNKTLSWNDRFALMDHFKPSDEIAMRVFGVTADELETAKELRQAGTFIPTPDLDVDSYSSLFVEGSNSETTTTTTSHTKPKTATSTKDTTQPPASATSHTTPKKRGRKGNKIATAFKSIPNTPVPVESFMKEYNVSLAVLRQSKRFDVAPELGQVRVRKDKETNMLMIWRESN